MKNPRNNSPTILPIQKAIPKLKNNNTELKTKKTTVLGKNEDMPLLVLSIAFSFTNS